MLFANGSVTPLMRLSRSKVLLNVGASTPASSMGRPARPMTRPGVLSPRDCLARRVLVIKSGTGVTRLVTGRVCSVHRDGGLLLHKRGSGVPGSKRTLGVVLRNVGRRRRTFVRLFANAIAARIAARAFRIVPSKRTSHTLLKQFSHGLKLLRGSSLKNAPVCVSVGGEGSIPRVMVRSAGGGGDLLPGGSSGGGGRPGRSKLMCGLPNGTSMGMCGGASALTRTVVSLPRFNCARALSSSLFDGGGGMGIILSPRANTLLGIRR